MRNILYTHLTITVSAAVLLLGLAGCASTPGIIPAPQPRSTTSLPPVSTADQKRSAAEVHTKLAKVYMAHDRIRLSIKRAREAIKYDPSYMPAFQALAMAYTKAGMMDLAQKYYEKALALKPKDGSLQNNYGLFLCKKGASFSVAEQHFHAALADPFYQTPTLAWSNMGRCRLRDAHPHAATTSVNKGDLNTAASDFQHALAIDPGNPFALMGMAKVNYLTGNTSSAVSYAQQWVQRGIVDKKGLSWCAVIADSANRDDLTAKCQTLLVTRYSNKN